MYKSKTAVRTSALSVPLLSCESQYHVVRRCSLLLDTGIRTVTVTVSDFFFFFFFCGAPQRLSRATHDCLFNKS